MTTDQIKTAIRKKALETSTEIIAEDQLDLYVNLAYQDVIKTSFPNSAVTSATVNFTGGTGTLPTDFGTLYGDSFDANGNVFSETSIADFQRLDNNNGLVLSGGQLLVSPDTTSSVTIYYYPRFETLSSGIDPTIDSFLHEPIVYGALARVFEDLQDVELAQFYDNKFQTMLKDRNDKLSNYEEDSQRGGAMFNGISIIGGGVNDDPNHW